MFGLNLVLCSANESIFFQLETDVWGNTITYTLDNIHMQRTTAPPSPWGSPQISKLPRVPIGKSWKQLNLEILGLRSPHAGPFVDVPRICESTGRGHGDRPQHQMWVGGQGVVRGNWVKAFGHLSHEAGGSPMLCWTTCWATHGLKCSLMQEDDQPTFNNH